MPAKLSEHMLRRGKVFYFRRAIPRALWLRFGRREIKASLGTQTLFVARIRCRLFSNAFEQLIATVGRRGDLTKSQVDQLVRAYFERLLSQAEEVAYLAPSDPELDVEFEIAGLSAEREEIREQLAAGAMDGHTIVEAKELANSTKGLGHEEFDLLCRGVLRAKAEQRRILVAMLQGAYDDTAPIDPLFKGAKSPGLPPAPGEASNAGAGTVATLVDKYCAFKSAQNWVPKTHDENRRVLSWFQDHVGAQRDISSLTVEDVRGFWDLLLKLPKQFTKLNEFSGKTLAEIAGMNPAGLRLGAGTLQKYFACVRSFLSWCEDESYVDANPAKKIKIGAKPNSYDAREPFSKSQLKILFNSPQYRGHISVTSRAKPGMLVVRDGKFWIPLVGLCTGMRLGEIVQLLVSDICKDDELNYFDVNKNDGGQKSLKSKASQRAIPVHKGLDKMGFLNFVETRRAEDPKGRLFPEVKPGKNGYYSHNFSKYFSRYLKQVGIKTEKTAFHSFRHSFTDALRAAEIEDSHVKALLGHADASITAIYGSGVPLKVLAGDMAKVEFEVKLDHLYLSDSK